MTRDPEPGPSDELEGSRAPFLEHLEELRWRLWRALLGVIIAGAGCFFFKEALFDFLTWPLFKVLEDRGLPPEVHFRTVAGAFMFHFKTAMLGGVFFGVPVVLYQGWMFVAPGLYRNERRIVEPFVVLSTLCFVGGGLFGYALALPGAFDFLIGYAQTGTTRQLLPQIMLEDYLGFTTKLLLAFGLVFETPVAILFLAGIGLVTHRGLIRYWRYAVVVAFVLGALLTPPDWVSQALLAGPLVVLYFISIGIAYVITKRREADAGATPSDSLDV